MESSLLQVPADDVRMCLAFSRDLSLLSVKKRFHFESDGAHVQEAQCVSCKAPKRLKAIGFL